MQRERLLSLLRWITLAGVYGGLLMPLVFIPIVIFPFVFSKLIAFQILIGLTFPAYLALAWADPRYRPRFHLLYGAIVAYFIAMALSVVFAVDPYRAWWGNQERMNGLFTLLHLFAWLTMTISVLKTWDQWKRLLNYEVALSLFMAIVALLQKVIPDLLMFKVEGRVGGLLDNPIYMGAYQIFNLFFLALLFLKTPSRSMRVWFCVIAIFDVFAFFAGQSRGALLGLAAGIVTFALFVALFGKEKKLRYGALGGLAFVILAYGLLFAFRDTEIVRHSMFARLTNFSTTVGTRLIAWKIAWNGFLERPITGWGLDNFHLLFNMRYNPESLRFGTYETWFDRAHNTVLDVLSMTGILGFVTFFGIFGALFYTVWRAFKRAWIDLPIAAILVALPVAYFVQNLFVFDHPAGFSMSYLLFALVIAATRQEFIGSTTTVEHAVGKARSVPLWGLAVLQLAALLLVWKASVIPFRVSMLAIRANQQFFSPASMPLLQEAAALWTPYLDEQTFLLSRNIMTLAGANALDRFSPWKEAYALTKQLTTEELRRHPNNTHPHFVFARLLDDLSVNAVPQDAVLAEKEYRAAIDASPKRQQIWYSLARFYLLRGRKDEAIEIFRIVKDFDAESGQGLWSYGLSLMYDKQDMAEGSKYLVQSQNVKFPYSLSNIRELVPLADAYKAQNQRKAFDQLLEKLLPNLAQSGVDAISFAQIAYNLQKLGWTTERDLVLEAGMKVDPTVKSVYEQGVRQMTTTSSPPTINPAQTATATSWTTRVKGSRGPRK